MAKQPAVTRDRFRIIAETSADAMGPLLAQLTRMGLENIGYELITDVRSFRQNGERPSYDVSTEDMVRAFIKDHPTFQVKELTELFVGSGRAKSGPNQILTAMVKSGELERLGGGNYKRTDVKEIAPPQPKPGKGQTPRYDVPNLTLILKAMKGRKKISLGGMEELLNSHGRPKKSASPILSRLAKQKLLKQIGPGLYELTGKQLPEPKAAPKKSEGRSKSDESKERDRLRAQAYRDKMKAEKQPGQEEASNG